MPGIQVIFSGTFNTVKHLYLACIKFSRR